MNNLHVKIDSNLKLEKARTKDVESDEANVYFEDLQLSKEVLAGLKHSGYIRPSPVQLKAIPLGNYPIRFLDLKMRFFLLYLNVRKTWTW